MASLVSLSSTTLPSPAKFSSIHLLSSSFKGNVGNLRAKGLTFEQCKRRLRCSVGNRRSLFVVNQTASLAAGLGIDGVVEISTERLRLDNLGPQPGSRKRAKRKGRGISAGQGKSCGFGMRGQKSRSGPGVRKGFEGGQMPLYRRIPKLRGIAGGMHAGLPKYVHINLKELKLLGLEKAKRSHSSRR